MKLKSGALAGLLLGTIFGAVTFILVSLYGSGILSFYGLGILSTILGYFGIVGSMILVIFAIFVAIMTFFTCLISGIFFGIFYDTYPTPKAITKGLIHGFMTGLPVLAITFILSVITSPIYFVIQLVSYIGFGLLLGIVVGKLENE